MCKKMQTILLFILIITNNVALGISNNNINNHKGNHKKHNSLPENVDKERIKRSMSMSDDEIPFWSNRGKKQIDDKNNQNKYTNAIGYNHRVASYNLDRDNPFWGNRGRRNSMESSHEYEYPEYSMKDCEHCVEIPIKYNEMTISKDRRDDFLSPFWGSRGRRNSLEEEDISDPFWVNRGRRQEKEPFWGNRGRRTDRRDNEPFWGNRGRREDMDPFWGNRGRPDIEPFWGNRGRRQDSEPFWGNRGRREDEPFWGNRGRRKDLPQNWARNEKGDLKNSILRAINDIGNNKKDLSRLKKSDPGHASSFWIGRGSNNKLNPLFNGPRARGTFLQKPIRFIPGQHVEPGTVLENRMYVDEPNFILVERSGRSSDEDDPYYISRGKKYNFNYSLEQAARDRRGAIEEIVKSVLNDPYYIARGKKNHDTKNSNSSETKAEYIKAKDLICAALELIMSKKEADRDKREISDNERDRRTTLKQLAAQLQIDPYFVSRGKKNDVSAKDYLQEFIKDIAEKCD